jgi:aryl-alcohol dehydrogenase-like predicted oxidoreductase
MSEHFNLATFICAQDEYSLLNRTAEKQLIPALGHYGMGLSPYFPLASGLLTGKYSGGATPAQGRLTENFLRLGNQFLTERNLRIVAALEEFCQARGHTLLELAVSWLLAQPVVASVIGGATEPGQIEQNVKAGDWILSAEDLARVNEITQ